MPAGSTRSGSTVKQLVPDHAARPSGVATTLPVTLATNMVLISLAINAARLPGDDQFFIGRHDPKLHAAILGVDRGFAFGVVIFDRIEVNAEPIQVAHTSAARIRDGVFPDAAGEDDGVGSAQQKQVRPQIMPHRRHINVKSLL